MPRIRTIKPEFPEDETLGMVSRDARLLYVLIWTRCDDHGRFRASPVLLRSNLFPYDEDLTASQVAGWLGELSETGRVELYETEGQSYGWVIRWSNHQRIDNAAKPLCPPPPSTLHGEPPQAAESLGEPPLDLDPDPEKDPDPERATPQAAASDLPADLWTRYANRQYAAMEKKPKNAMAWKNKVAENGEKELTDRALELTERFVLTPSQLVDALIGSTNVLKNAAQRLPREAS